MGKYIDSSLVRNERIIMEAEFALADNWMEITLTKKQRKAPGFIHGDISCRDLISVLLYN